MPSVEFRNLQRLRDRPAPDFLMTRAGDLWHTKPKDGGHEYVLLVMGHKKRGRHRNDGHTYVYMYHWSEPSLVAKPCDLRDNDGNALMAEATLISCRARGQIVRYLGNIFEMLPLSELLA